MDYGHGALRSREGVGLGPEELLCGSRSLHLAMEFLGSDGRIILHGRVEEGV